VLIRTLVAPLLGTNCYLVSDPAGRCVIVDPGGGVSGSVRDAVAEADLVPTIILITHGHLDHTWDAAAVAGDFSVPVLIHAQDAYRLDDPLGTLGALGEQIAAMAGASTGPPRPSRVESFATGADGTTRIDPRRDDDGTAGPIGITAIHCPGHTEGSTVYLITRPDGPDVALTGDVLFAGTIGRVDLPGGDTMAMEATLRRLARLDPETEILPGHGPASTIAAELTGNPYLRSAR
jgi:glyoxylase-like metal-dependent hydrolase (beta-lactamase superfamily II)